MFINSTFRNCLKKVRRQHISSNSAKPVSGIRLVLSNSQGLSIPQLKSRNSVNNIYIVKLYLQTWSAGSEYDNHSRLSLYLTYISVVDILFWQFNSHKVPSDWPLKHNQEKFLSPFEPRNRTKVMIWKYKIGMLQLGSYPHTGRIQIGIRTIYQTNVHDH